MFQDEGIAFTRNSSLEARSTPKRSPLAMPQGRLQDHCNLLGECHNTVWIKVTTNQGMWFRCAAFDRIWPMVTWPVPLARRPTGWRGSHAGPRREALATAYGSDILKAIQTEACTRWQHQP